MAIVCQKKTLGVEPLEIYTHKYKNIYMYV